MNAFAHFPAHLHWTAQQLTDAVPLRLHELFAFDAPHDTGAANGERQRPRDERHYSTHSTLPDRFGIR